MFHELLRGLQTVLVAAEISKKSMETKFADKVTHLVTQNWHQLSHKLKCSFVVRVKERSADTRNDF